MSSNRQEGRILVMGIGNYLMGDEGIGPHVAERLPAYPLPAFVDVVDGGTGGFHLLEYFERYDTVILIDATLDDNETGTVRLIRPRFAQDFPRAMSTHDIGLKDMVSALQLLDRMPDIHLFVVSIESVQQQGIELTPEVEQQVPALCEKIIALIDTLACKREPEGNPDHYTLSQA